MAFSFPKIYPILDASVIPAAGRKEFLRRLGGGPLLAAVRQISVPLLSSQIQIAGAPPNRL